MSTLISDFRYSIRSLLKNPGLTVAAVLSLGLGIGANTTIFTWVQAVLFRPIPVAADPSAIRIAAMENREGQSRSWSYPNYQDFRDRATLIDVVAQDDQTFSIAVDDTAERTWGALVSGNYFQVMGLRAAAGRLFTPQDDVTPGGHPVVVISHAYWQRRFSGDPAIVGKQRDHQQRADDHRRRRSRRLHRLVPRRVLVGVGADGDAARNDGRRSHARSAATAGCSRSSA